jgi:cytidyltransferase-like protein
MNKYALFTGTFDPFHIAHRWQLERAYAVDQFDKAFVAVIKQNPNKPGATPWRHRVKIAELSLGSANLPFKYEVIAIDYIYPSILKTLTSNIPELLIRVMGADSIIEIVDTPDLHGSLKLFEYLIVLRPSVPEDEVKRNIQRLPQAILKDFKFKFVYIQQDFDISARNLRGYIDESFQRGLIASSAYEYIKDNRLYNYSGLGLTLGV